MTDFKPITRLQFRYGATQYTMILYSLQAFLAVTAFNIIISAPYAAATCKDVEDTFAVTSMPWLLTNKEKRCAWAARLESRCDHEEVATACPETCGLCDTNTLVNDSTITECEDSADKFYISKINRKKYCTWASRLNTVTRCAQNIEVRANCRATCGLCDAPSASPSASPSKRPTPSPSKAPSRAPVPAPSTKPSAKPSKSPTKGPTSTPSKSPTRQPSSKPSVAPTGCDDSAVKVYVGEIGAYKFCSWAGNNPQLRCPYSNLMEDCPRSCGNCASSPSATPTISHPPSEEPSRVPSTGPTEVPTRPPSPMPSPFPSLSPSAEPSDAPSEFPSDEPSIAPSSFPSDEPSDTPSLLPSDSPSEFPSDEPSILPSDEPSILPSDEVSVYWKSTCDLSETKNQLR